MGGEKAKRAGRQETRLCKKDEDESANYPKKMTTRNPQLPTRGEGPRGLGRAMKVKIV